MRATGDTCCGTPATACRKATSHKLVEAALDHLAAAHHRLLVEDDRSLRPTEVHARRPKLECGSAGGGKAEHRDAGVVDADEVRWEEYGQARASIMPAIR